MQTESTSSADRGDLHRGLGLWQATSLNIANMVGIGPFITIPGFLAAMGGPQALVAWLIAALLVLCDGLVWSELGAALPGSGGSYHFLTEIFGRTRWGRIVPFLFIWQFLISGTLELASGYIGGAEYLRYPFPQLDATLSNWGVPGGVSSLAALAAIIVAGSLCRNIRSLGWLSLAFCFGTITTMLTVIVAGSLHFDVELVQWPKNAFNLSENPALFSGLAGAMTIAIYDYLGYYNVCHLGDEVVDPGKTIPRAVMISVVVVAVLYLTMNLAIIGVVPWERAMRSNFVASEFMEILFGRKVAEWFTVLIVWTVIAGVFSMTLGYSRIPFAAARNGHFFRIFSKIHPVHRFPTASLIWLGGLTALFCYLPLQAVINAAVVVRIVVQFIGQILGLHWLRRSRPEVPLPFRMWLYPLPSLLALAGWIFLFVKADSESLWIAIGVLVSGCLTFFVWSSRPFWERLYFDTIADQPERTRWFSPPARFVLHCLANLYEGEIKRRNRAYDFGGRTVERGSVPIVSVGNLTAGGTGKTPVAAFLAGWFLRHGVRVCFVSRGYGAAVGGLNDEALVLKSQCPGVPHLQNPDRIGAARMAVETHGSQLIILDDGFQHRRLARNLDLVLIDATNPWGYGYLLPRGLLREPISSLSRAGLAIITRVDRVPHSDVDRIRQAIAAANPNCRISEVAFPATRLVNAVGESAGLELLAGKNIAAFCGIGNPSGFRGTLEGLGCRIGALQAFNDHHNYSASDIDDLQRLVRRLSVEAVVCTQKDLVKLQNVELGGRPLWAVEIGVQIVAGGDELEAELQRVLTLASTNNCF